MLLNIVNSPARCRSNSAAINCRMDKELENWQIEDAARLRKLFAEKTTKSQAAFGQDFDIGTQGMVWQYLNARRALNLDALFKFAQGLEVEPKAISPTLWQKVSASIAREAALTEEQRLLLSLIEKIKDDAREPWLKLGELLTRLPEDRRKQDLRCSPDRRRPHFGIHYATRVNSIDSTDSKTKGEKK